MSNDDKIIPLEFCRLPGTIKVTDRAVQHAARFQASVPSGWIAAFIWFDGQGRRASKGAPLEDEGPGLGLGAYRSQQIPEEAVCHAGSSIYAVIMRKEIVDMHPNRTIDLDERGKPILT